METVKRVITARGRGVDERKGYGRESEGGDAALRWLRADIVCLICHLQVCAYYRERGKVGAECKVSMCVCI